MAATTRRRVIPDAFRSGSLRFEGTAPLLMHKDTFMDVAHDLTREHRRLVAKRSSSRTVDDEINIQRVEFHAGLHFDDEIGVHWPGPSVKAALVSAARRFNRGEPLRRGLIVVQQKIPVEYEGPRDREGLWDDGFYDVRSVVNSGRNAGRVPRCRPCFEEWALTFDLAYDPTECDADTMVAIAERAQVLGIGDYRPEFGTFIATWIEGP